MSARARTSLAAWTQRGAWLSFAALIVLSPFRARFDLHPRPAGNVYSDYTDVLFFWSDIPLLLTLCLWLCSLVLRPRAVSLGPRFLAWPVATLLIVTWLGTPFAVDPDLALMTSARLTASASLPAVSKATSSTGTPSRRPSSRPRSTAIPRYSPLAGSLLTSRKFP